MLPNYNSPTNYSYPWNLYNLQPQQSPQQQPQPQQPQTNNMSVVFIQGGEFTASNYMLAPNQSVVMIDNDSRKVFIKTTDASGMALSFRKFNEEIEPERKVQVSNDYVTRDEFEKAISELKNAKTTVSTTKSAKQQQ